MSPGTRQGHNDIPPTGDDLKALRLTYQTLNLYKAIKTTWTSISKASHEAMVSRIRRVFLWSKEYNGKGEGETPDKREPAFPVFYFFEPGCVPLLFKPWANTSNNNIQHTSTYRVPVVLSTLYNLSNSLNNPMKWGLYSWDGWDTEGLSGLPKVTQ